MFAQITSQTNAIILTSHTPCVSVIPVINHAEISQGDLLNAKIRYCALQPMQPASRYRIFNDHLWHLCYQVDCLVLCSTKSCHVRDHTPLEAVSRKLIVLYMFVRYLRQNSDLRSNEVTAWSCSIIFWNFGDVSSAIRIAYWCTNEICKNMYKWNIVTHKNKS